MMGAMSFQLRLWMTRPSRELIRMGNVAKLAYYLGPRAPELFSDPTEQRLVKGIRAQVAQLTGSGLTHRMLVDSIHIRFLTAAREYPNYRLVTWIDDHSLACLWTSVEIAILLKHADRYTGNNRRLVLWCLHCGHTGQISLLVLYVTLRLG